jgi:ERCC4-type nuclease
VRVDIKSESELKESRRREEEERRGGIAAIQEFPGVGAQLMERLVEHGLFSPRRIMEAGLERLMQVPGVGAKKAERLVAAAQEWVEQHPVASEATALMGAGSDVSGHDLPGNEVAPAG